MNCNQPSVHAVCPESRTLQRGTIVVIVFRGSSLYNTLIMEDEPKHPKKRIWISIVVNIETCGYDHGFYWI
jgi:hypothetical protein